jgi:hypothetical protein
LFFPEKRPFFLENAGYFRVGARKQVELFFSRRIGIGSEGEVIPIIGGARVTGKVAQRYNVGALYMRTEEVPGVAPQNDFAMARLSRDFPNRSYIGGIVVSRQGSGEFASEDDYNRTFGLDGRWGIGEYGLIEGFAAKTETPGAEEGEYAFRLGAKYDSGRWYWSFNHTEVTEDFNPEVGFVDRTGYRKPWLMVMRRIRPPKYPFGVLEFRPFFYYRSYWKLDGFQETRYFQINIHTEWLNAYELHTGMNVTREGVIEPFEIYPGVVVPPGTYDHSEAVVDVITNQGAPVSLELNTIAGGFFGGKRLMMSPVLRFRIGEAFNTELAWIYNDIDLPYGAFETNLGRLRVNYSFTPLIFIQALVQYNDLEDSWATNLRFSWLRTANTGLNVVYNEIQDVNGSGTGVPNRSLIVKYSYMFDVLR